MDYVNSLLAQLQAYPMLSAAVAIFVALVRFGFVKLPVQIPLVSPTVQPEGDGHDPLRDRAAKAAVNQFNALVDDGDDADEAYSAVVRAIRAAEIKETK